MISFSNGLDIPTLSTPPEILPVIETTRLADADLKYTSPVVSVPFAARAPFAALALST